MRFKFALTVSWSFFVIPLVRTFYMFLVGAFLVKRARLLQWLVFFLFFVRLFTHRVCTTFCELFTFTKSTQYLILNASKGLYLEMQNPEGSPFQFFGAMRLPRPFSALWDFFRNFLKSSKGPLLFFWYFATNWIFKKPKESPFYKFKNFALFEPWTWRWL